MVAFRTESELGTSEVMTACRMKGTPALRLVEQRLALELAARSDGGQDVLQHGAGSGVKLGVWTPPQEGTQTGEGHESLLESSPVLGVGQQIQEKVGDLQDLLGGDDVDPLLLVC